MMMRKQGKIRSVGDLVGNDSEHSSSTKSVKLCAKLVAIFRPKDSKKVFEGKISE